MLESKANGASGKAALIQRFRRRQALDSPGTNLATRSRCDHTSLEERCRLGGHLPPGGPGAIQPRGQGDVRDAGRRGSVAGLTTGRCGVPSGPWGAGRSGRCPVGDILLGIDGAEVLSADDTARILEGHRSGDNLSYAVLRASERRIVELVIAPLPQGNVTLFYYLSLVGFFSLVVGAIVAVRRPANRTTLHFYAICALFFLVYSTSSTGRLDSADWLLFWADHLATLFLPMTFLHFCLVFPERRLAPRSFLACPSLRLSGGGGRLHVGGAGTLRSGRGQLLALARRNHRRPRQAALFCGALHAVLRCAPGVLSADREPPSVAVR